MYLPFPSMQTNFWLTLTVNHIIADSRIPTFPIFQMDRRTGGRSPKSTSSEKLLQHENLAEICQQANAEEADPTPGTYISQPTEIARPERNLEV